MKNASRIFLAVLLHSLATIPAYPSAVSVGINGINSSGLGLTGSGVGIGQLEFSRPSDNSFDTSASLINSQVNPTQVYYIETGMMGGVSTAATMNDSDEMTEPSIGDTDGHATQVASVIISPSGLTTGVAPQAMLHSGGYDAGFFVDELDAAAVAGQHIATRNSGQIHAVNMSFGIEDTFGEGIPNGTSILSSFLDWSSRVHDVLYVTGGNEMGPALGANIPADDFNGMTVAFSQPDGFGTFRRVHSGNEPIEDPFSDRTFVDILAPGLNIAVEALGNATINGSGTSFAAPHVTGTVALLQQHGNQQAGWGIGYKRHEVMKAAIMNSADKVSGRLGMTRTVEKANGDTWDQSPAATDPLIPLDEDMGAGHLNASRALQQFSPGEFDPNGAPVPVIGWDLGSTAGLDSVNKYVFDQELAGGSYISITLAWDRRVEFSEDDGTPGVFDSGDAFQAPLDADADDVINDLDLYVLPRGATSELQAIWRSEQDYMPLEHLFVPINTAGEYEIWVRQFDDDLGGGQEYTIAWWTEGTGTSVTGDFDGDGDVDGRDFLAWQRGSSPTPLSASDLADWQANFGTGALAATTAVPEPSCLALLLPLAALLLRRRNAA